jgi:hypothetical protein
MEQEGSNRGSDTETLSSLSSSSPNPVYTTTCGRIISDALTHSGDQRLVLPPQPTLAQGSPHYSGKGTRSAEDQRIIHLLNSRYIR